jgi:glycosyltransferase involved in cell wall biosynthesis
MLRMSKQLRILACNWRCIRHPQAGGAEVNLFEQARRWVRDGHQVVILSADPGREHAPEQNEVIDGIEVRRMGGRFTVYFAAALFVLLRSHQFDRILDVANGIPFLTPLVSRCPVTLLVHHVHDRQWFSEFSWPVAALGHFVERYVVPRVYRNNEIIAVSPTTRDALVESGLTGERVHVVYNGAIPPAISPPADEERVPFRVIYVGRLKRYKRLDRLVRAIASLRDEFPAIHLDIVGDGDARSEIEALRDQLDLRGHISVHGYVDEARKASLLRSAAVFATPSMHEGWGLSVIEANLHGCPAVAYDVPGLRAAIRDGETGSLARDDAEFIRAIALLLQDPDTRARCSIAALQWAARFDWDACARETLEVLWHAGGEPGAVLVASA